MQEQPPELSVDEIASLTHSQYAHLGQPQPVKVFGIIHLIFGGFGVLTAIWAWIVIIIGNPMLKFMGNSPQQEIQSHLESELLPYSIIGAVLNCILTFLIIRAGILLLKKRKAALKWSNAYAYTSIIIKVLNLILTLTYILPMTQQIMNTSMPSSPGAGTLAVGSIMFVSTIFGFLFSLVYPVLTLILLNRPTVKTWCAYQAD
jgi:hypothetical protein